MFKKSRKDKLVDQTQSVAQGVARDVSDAIAPKMADARDALAPRIAEARDTVADRVSDARDTYGPKVSQAVHDARVQAREQAVLLAAEAERRSALAGAALKGEDVEAKRPRSKAKSLLVIAVLAGAGAFVARKLAGGGNADNWQSSYTPAPAPAPAPGASPGETVADSVEEPHPVTTPENPVETVEVDDKRS